MSGQVDAVIGAFRNFELNQMDIEGVAGRCFYLEEEGIPPYDELIYVTNPNLMDADMVRRFIGLPNSQPNLLSTIRKKAGKYSLVLPRATK